MADLRYMTRRLGVVLLLVVGVGILALVYVRSNDTGDRGAGGPVEVLLVGGLPVT